MSSLYRNSNHIYWFTQPLINTLSFRLSTSISGVKTRTVAEPMLFLTSVSVMTHGVYTPYWTCWSYREFLDPPKTALKSTFVTVRTVYTHMAYTCINALGVGGKHSVFLIHLDSALAHTLAHIDYVLTTRNGSLALCLFTHKWITVEYCILCPNQVLWTLISISGITNVVVVHMCSLLFTTYCKGCSSGCGIPHWVTPINFWCEYIWFEII
jgi:hypothetical protein